MIVIAGWAGENVSVKLNINWKNIGLSNQNVQIIAPAVENFQSEREFNINDTIPIEPGKGWLIIIKSS